MSAATTTTSTSSFERRLAAVERQLGIFAETASVAPLPPKEEQAGTPRRGNSQKNETEGGEKDESTAAALTATSATAAAASIPTTKSILPASDRVTELERRYHALLKKQQQQQQSSQAGTTGGGGSSSTTTTPQSSQSSLRSNLIEIAKLLDEELDPGTALTHQQQVRAPILYRRQEVLCRADSFRSDLERVGEILALLSISTTSDNNESATATTKKNKLQEHEVTQAPIVASAERIVVVDEYRARLSELERALADEIGPRAEQSVRRFDELLNQYRAAIEAVSEKTVALDGLLRQRGQ